MVDGRCRPLGRLCYWAAAVLVGLLTCVPALGAAPVPLPQSGPATTTVADTVYQADGTVAQGTLIITWPAFVTAGGAAVAPGSTTTTLGAGGALSVALVPNAGANPAGVYYTVVYQIGPGQVKTEYWVVPTTSPANLATVRTTPGSGVAGQPVSLQYVNSELATKANDNAVVHLSGAETISGTKTFSATPSVPVPTAAGQVANKGYVDQAVSNVGAGNFLPTAGGTMTGPITLPGNPAAPMQATTKQYVDTGIASKADLISGQVPVGELGSGLASSGSCLVGNGSAAATWGVCGGGSGSGNISTNPSATQAIAQPSGTQFSTNNLANIRYVTSSWNWAQTPADNLGTAGNVTIHLSPCPLGIDTTSSSNYYVYKVYISGTGTAETAAVTGGSCTPGATSGTITVTTVNAHPAGYMVGSASSGIQEAWNDAWVSDSNGAPYAASESGPYVKLAAGVIYNVYATVFLRGRGGVFDGNGSFLACYTRDRCVFIGTLQSYPYVLGHKVYNLSLSSAVLVDGANVAGVTATSGTYTVTTAANHPFVAGDMVDCEYHSQNAEQHWVGKVLSAGLTATSFEAVLGSGSATFSASANTFGWCNILNAAVEDNSDHVTIQDLNIFGSNATGSGEFNYGIVNDNDQSLVVERVTNRADGAINPNGNHGTATWPIGAFLYQRTDQGLAGITYLHNFEFSNINCMTGGGNGMVATDGVCQGFPVFGFRYFGGLQPATFQNVYQESTGGTVNPLYGYGGQAGYVLGGGFGETILGTFPANGNAPVFNAAGSACTVRNYFVVPHASVYGAYPAGAGPVMFIGSSNPANCGGVNIPLVWPSVGLQNNVSISVGTLTWDVLVTTGVSALPPSGTGNFAIATNISASCGVTGMCSFTDTQSAPTSYTVSLPQQFGPVFWFWPTTYAINKGPIFVQNAATGMSAVSSLGMAAVSIIAERCISVGVQPAQRTPIWVQCLASDGAGAAGTMATVLQQHDTAGGSTVNTKGRINLEQAIVAPSDLITLQDSNFQKTLATGGHRPSYDAGDMALGLDQAGGLAERSPTSISAYINALPSGTNYQERLTTAGKTFNVPVTVNGNLAVSGGSVTLPVTGTGAQCLHVSSTGVLSGTGADCGAGGSGGVNGGTASQVAMYSSSGAVVSGDSTLTDSGTTLNYSGSGGIAAASGTFSGNLTVNGQLLVAGPWTVSSPVPGTAMGSAGAGTSALGISNDGNFYVSSNGGTPVQVATTATSSYFSNLFQEDANDLGEYNGTNPQGLRVYGTYTNSSNFERTGLAWDATDGLFVLKNENAGTGQQRGIGFWIGNNVRWGIDTLSTLKPYTNNSFNVGSVAYAPQTVYAATSFDTLSSGHMNFELCNDTTTGTAQNFLAVYNGASPACAVKAGTGATDGVIGVVSGGSGTSGNAVITYRGYVSCSFDGGTTAGDYVVASTTNAGDCHDAGATRPAGVQVLGRAELTNSGAGTYGMRASLDGPGLIGLGDPGANGIVARTSVNSTVGRTLTAGSGNVTITNGSGVSGNPTVDVSTANLFSSPALTGTPTAPTASAGDNSTKVATTAYVKNETWYAWTCPVAGSTAVSQNCNWTLPAGLTITGFDFAANTAPAGCTTYPIVQLWDGTSAAEVGSYSVTLSSGTNFYTQVTGSANVVAGHLLRVKVTTAAAGCTTNAQGMVATVTYQMQN